MKRAAERATDDGLYDVTSLPAPAASAPATPAEPMIPFSQWLRREEQRVAKQLAEMRAANDRMKIDPFIKQLTAKIMAHVQAPRHVNADLYHYERKVTMSVAHFDSRQREYLKVIFAHPNFAVDVAREYVCDRHLTWEITWPDYANMLSVPDNGVNGNNDNNNNNTEKRV